MGSSLSAEYPMRRFRPDLEGLRAVAVVLVLLYHAKIPGFPGGFVGVDVFFVLSGFLITGLIYRELEATEQLSLARFYARRARRLLPAAAVVLLCTLAASIWLLPAFRMPSLAADVSSAALYVSNMRFGIQANDYFQATADPSPVLHFWSLSVEEQFYIFWPAFLIVLVKWLPWRGSSPRTGTAIGILVLGIGSFIASVFLTGLNQPWAFFLFPTRAWELAVGGLLAVVAARRVAMPNLIAALATFMGVAVIILAAVVLDDDTPFPGVAAILPVAGAALVVLGGLPERHPLPSRALSLGPFRYLGRISYSLYLWHWPILVFGGLIFGATLSPVLALAAIPVAAASQHWIEEPFRHGHFIGVKPGRNLSQAAAIGLVVVALSLVAAQPPNSPAITASGLHPPASPLPSQGPSAASTMSQMPLATVQASETTTSQTSGPSASPEPTAASLSPALSPSALPPDTPAPCAKCSIADLSPPLSDLLAGRFENCRADELPDSSQCILGDPLGTHGVVAVFGDSHAASWTPALAQIAVQRGLRLVVLTHPGCPAELITVWSYDLKRANSECDAWRQLAFARLEAERPSLVIIANSYEYGLVDAKGARVSNPYPPSTQWRQLWSAGLKATLDQLATLRSTLVVMADVPQPAGSKLDPACIAQHATDFQTCHAPRPQVVLQEYADLEDSISRAGGAVFVDPTPWLCDPVSCPAVIGRYVVYADTVGHLTAPFAVSLGGRLLMSVPFPP